MLTRSRVYFGAATLRFFGAIAIRDSTASTVRRLRSVDGKTIITGRQTDHFAAKALALRAAPQSANPHFVFEDRRYRRSAVAGSFAATHTRILLIPLPNRPFRTL